MMREIKNWLGQICCLDDAADLEGTFVLNELSCDVEEFGGELKKSKFVSHQPPLIEANEEIDAWGYGYISPQNTTYTAKQ